MYQRIHGRRGTAMTLGIIVSIFMSALVTMLAWVAGEGAQRTGSLSKLDQAFYAAEAGAQRVQWYCTNGQMGSITSPLAGTINGDSYSVTWSTVSGSTILITSVGSLGGVSYTLSQQVTPPVTAQPVIALGDNFNNKNTTVTGNLITGGSYSNSGGGSLNGNLTYYAGATNTGSVTGTITKATGSFAFINMTTLGNTLIAAAGRTYTGTQTNQTFDFTTISGTNKVIYVNGPVVNPTFIGSGTLYSSGAVSGLGSFGTASNPVNIVAKAAITNTSGNLTIYGSIYTGGAWSYGQITMNGLAYVSGTISSTSSSVSSITMTTTPWFDPRGSSGGSSSTTTVANFSGPMP